MKTLTKMVLACAVILLLSLAAGIQGQESTSSPNSSTTPAAPTGPTKDPRLTGDPNKDYLFDPNLPRELNGHDLSTYPFYIAVPENITFICTGRHDGYYASIEHHCQLFHYCVFSQRYDFLCANYTLFDQTTFTCRFVNSVNCAASEKYYDRNDALYTTTTTARPFRSKFRPRTTLPPDEYYDDYEDDETTTTTPKPRRRKINRPKPRSRKRTTTTTTTTTQDPEYEEYYEDDEEGVSTKPPPTSAPARGIKRPATVKPTRITFSTTTEKLVVVTEKPELNEELDSEENDPSKSRNSKQSVLVTEKAPKVPKFFTTSIPDDLILGFRPDPLGSESPESEGQREYLMERPRTLEKSRIQRPIEETEEEHKIVDKSSISEEKNIVRSRPTRPSEEIAGRPKPRVSLQDRNAERLKLRLSSQSEERSKSSDERPNRKISFSDRSGDLDKSKSSSSIETSSATLRPTRPNSIKQKSRGTFPTRKNFQTTSRLTKAPKTTQKPTTTVAPTSTQPEYEYYEEEE